VVDQLIIRVSQLNRYNDCPRGNAVRFMRRQIEKDGHTLAETQPSVAAAMGTAVHAMVAELFKQKMQFGECDVDEAFDNRETGFIEEISKGCEWDATTNNVDVAKLQLKSLCRAFLPVVSVVDPVAVEDEMEYLVSPLGGEAVPILLIGHRDVKDKHNEIHDHKTTSSKEIPKCHAQLGGYALLSMYNGEEVSGVRVNAAPRLPKSRVHECAVRSVRFDLAECLAAAWNTLREIQTQYMTYLEKGDEHVFPANQYSQSCTPKYCSAYNSTWCKVGCCE